MNLPSTSPDKPEKKSTDYFWLAPAIGWAVWVLIMGMEPNPKSDWLSSMFGDKVLHIGSFALGGILWIHSIRRVGRLRFLTASILGGVISFAFGILLEVFQRRIPGSEADPGDVMADLTGVLIAVILYVLASVLGLSKKGAKEPNL
ncbi:VanZ family protein [bacterium]|nr:VanZ family protein [bacterium]